MAGGVSQADWKAWHGILCFAALAAGTFVPVLRMWPWLWIAPLAVYFILVAIVPPLRRSFSGWSFGRIDGAAVLATILIMVLSSGTLVLFQRWAHPDLRTYVAALPMLVGRNVVVAGFVFPVLNAFCEELIFRGIFFTAIESQTGKTVAVIGTAFLFGYGHMHGYPPGPLGAMLAGIYGLALGWLRVFTGGLGLPVIAHIAADAAIFAILVHATKS